MPKIQELLLDATAKFVQQLALPEQNRKSSNAPWIDFSAKVASEEKDELQQLASAPAIIKYDEKQVLR